MVVYCPPFMHKIKNRLSQLRTNEKTGKYEFYPIEREANVDKRRASVGLEPLEQYAKYFGVDYILPKTKK